jgi:serine/threonine protein phosphatase PrpC
VAPPTPVKPLAGDGGVVPVTVGHPAREGHLPGRLAAPSTRSAVAADGVQVGDDLLLRAASVRGAGHRHEGGAREDCYAVRLAGGGAYVVVAVADGVSAAAAGGAGAAAAAAESSKALQRALTTRSPEQVDAAGLMRHVARQMTRHAGGDACEQDSAALACTLAVAVVPVTSASTWPVWTARLGDATAAVLDADGWQFAFDGGDAGGDGGVYALPLHPRRVQTAWVELCEGAALVVCTDGLADPLGNGRGEVGAWLADRWAEPPSWAGFAVDVAFDRATYTDDRTAVGVWAGQASRPGEDV